jgi:hypothetical protein
VERRLTPLRTGRIGQQLLSALAAAHNAGVLHRDVKPSNVLIATDRGGSGWDERAVLTDFGIAQFEGDPRLTQTGMVMGSPGFTAPERIRGGDASPASDLWSLGATLYAAAEGRGPYEQRGGAITTMSAIINEDAPVAAHAGPLGPVIAALLRREPSARPSAAAAARMFAQLLPQLAKLTDRPHEVTHPVTVRAAPLPVPVPTAAAGSAAAAPPVEAAPDDSAQAAEPEAASEPEPTPGLAPAPPEDQADAADAADGTLEASAEPGVSTEPEVSTEPASENPAREPEPAGEAEAEAEREPDANVPAAAEAEAAEVPGDSVDAGAPEEAGAAKAPAVMVLEAAASSGVPQTVIDRDRGSAGYRPTELSIPVASPAQGPRFTASQRKERAAPTFSASRQDHSSAAQADPQPVYGAPQATAAQHGPYPGTTAPIAGSGGQYGGPSQAHADLAGQYPPGTGGGRAQRRGRPWRWIAAVIGAVVLAVAIGAGAAYALGHHGAGAQGSRSGTNGTGTTGSGTVSDPLTRYASVNALNHPSAVVPAGWTPEQVTASEAGSYTGFTIDLPPGWTEHRGDFATTFTGPDGMVLEIDLTPATYKNMFREASYIARRAAPKFTGYRLLYLQAVPVRSAAGAIWQFERTSANGVTLTADDIVFIERTPAGSQSYAVYIRAPSSGWGSTYLPAFDKILPTFQTLPAS